MNKVRKVILIFFILLVPHISHAAIKLTSPNGGEILLIGKTQRVTWTGGGEKISLFRISCIKLSSGEEMCYSGDRIVTEIDNNGYYDWVVVRSSSYSDKYRLQVVDVNSTTTDRVSTSENTLIITDNPKLDFIIVGQLGDTTYVSNNEVNGSRIVSLAWNTENITSCQGSGDWTGAKAIGFEPRSFKHSEDIGLSTNFTTDKTYTLTCNGPAGEVSKSLKVILQGPPKTVTEIVKNQSRISITLPNNLVVGNPYTLAWESVNGDFDYYMIGLGNHLLPGSFSGIEPARPMNVDKDSTSVTFIANDALTYSIKEALNNTHSTDEIRKNYFITITAEKKWTYGNTNGNVVVARGETPAFSISVPTSINNAISTKPEVVRPVAVPSKVTVIGSTSTISNFPALEKGKAQPTKEQVKKITPTTEKKGDSIAKINVATGTDNFIPNKKVSLKIIGDLWNKFLGYFRS